MTTKSAKSSRNGIRTIVLKNGQKSYEARINRRGLPAQSKCFPTRSEAVAWKNKIETAIDQGDRVSKNRKHLIKDIIDAYLLHRSAELNAPNPIPENKTYDYQRVKMDLGDMYVDKLTNEDVENYVRLLLVEPTLQSSKFKDKTRTPQKYAPATVRKFYYALKKAVTWHAKRHKYHLDADLFEMEDEVIPSAWAGHRERRLEAGEEEKLYDAGLNKKNTYSKDDWKAIIGFALETALREQEIVYARWKDIGSDNKALRIPPEHTKTRTGRTVLLSSRAVEIINAQRAQAPKDNPRIFWQFTSPDSVCTSFARLVTRAKIVGLHFHDLRHEATSRLCERNELSMPEIMEMTGHTNLSTFLCYIHLLKHRLK